MSLARQDWIANAKKYYAKKYWSPVGSYVPGDTASVAYTQTLTCSVSGDAGDAAFLALGGCKALAGFAASAAASSWLDARLVAVLTPGPPATDTDLLLSPSLNLP